MLERCCIPVCPYLCHLHSEHPPHTDYRRPPLTRAPISMTLRSYPWESVTLKSVQAHASGTCAVCSCAASWWTVHSATCSGACDVQYPGGAAWCDMSMQLSWHVAELACGRNGMWQSWHVAELACLWHVAELACGRVGMWQAHLEDERSAPGPRHQLLAHRPQLALPAATQQPVMALSCDVAVCSWTPQTVILLGSRLLC